MANKELQARIETLSFKYIDYLEGLLDQSEPIEPAVVHAVNDSIRILHHLKKINNQPMFHEDYQ